MFRSEAGADGVMSFTHFMELALYHPTVGYYRRDRVRVGYGPGTDFFTAATSGPVFGELVSAACSKILRSASRDPAAHSFVEIGAESGGVGVLGGVEHPFAGVRTIQVGQPIDLRGDCVVFSNELFDAQPFARSVYRAGQWRETGVALRDGNLFEVQLDQSPPHSPKAGSEGYRFDQPTAAATLADSIASQSWRGLFVAFDYGKTYRELTEATPGGTARAYFQHTQSNDLLARPGQQDLTCHVCWDWIMDALQRQGFATPMLEFQEAFFVRHAGEFIARASAADAARLSRRKLSLMQLLHPSHLGQKFQVLHAVRS